ncbi:MAG: hypothetical protein OXB92_17405 [Acidimicrobiaceae bacterium]|nr:hypothetical protein [Acidimicrobiaceae bacterium]
MKPETSKTKKVGYYTINKVEIGFYRSDLEAKDFVGIDSLGKLTDNVKNIVKFVEISGKYGYYEDILEYRHVTKKGIYKGDKVCASPVDSYKLLSDGKDTPYRKGEFKAFFITNFTWKKILKTDYLGVDKDGYVVNDMTLVDKFMPVVYSVMDNYSHKFKPGQRNDKAILLREVKAVNNR